MPQFNQYPAPVLPLTGNEQLLLAQTQSGSPVSVTATVSDLTPGLIAGLKNVLTANGQLLIGSAGNSPVAATLTGTANQVIVTNGAGAVTLSLPQSINTAADVTFNSLAVNTLTVEGSSLLGSTVTDTVSIQGGNSAFASGGRLLLGTQTDDGVSQLQVGSTATTQTRLGYGQSALGGATSRAWLKQAVGTVAVAILPAIPYGAFVLVSGTDGTNNFSDKMSASGTNITLFNQDNLGTTPSARTYTIASNKLTLAMASGSYNVDVFALSIG